MSSAALYILYICNLYNYVIVLCYYYVFIAMLLIHYLWLLIRAQTPSQFARIHVTVDSLTSGAQAGVQGGARSGAAVRVHGVHPVVLQQGWMQDQVPAMLREIVEGVHPAMN